MSFNTEASELQTKITALSKVNAEIISTIENTVDSSPLGFLYCLNAPNSVNKQFTVTESKRMTTSQIWKPNVVVKLHDCEEMNLFNDNIDYCISSFEDLKRINTQIPLVVAKFGWLNAEKAAPVLRQFLANLEVVQVCLGQAEERITHVQSQLPRVNAILNTLNQTYEELVTEISKVNSFIAVVDQKKVIKETTNRIDYQVGHIYYVVSCSWYKKWNYFVECHQSAENFPGPIDNSNIVGQDGLVRQSTYEGIDYVILSSECWELLHRWYGGGPALPREVITGENRMPTVEVHPLLLQVFKLSDKQTCVSIAISRAATVEQLKKVACSKLTLKPEDVRVWDYYNSKKYKLLEDMSQRLDTAQMQPGQLVLIEEKDAHGRFPS